MNIFGLLVAIFDFIIVFVLVPADSILKRLMFTDEVQLPEDGIDGSDVY